MNGERRRDLKSGNCVGTLRCDFKITRVIQRYAPSFDSPESQEETKKRISLYFTKNDQAREGRRSDVRSFACFWVDAPTANEHLFFPFYRNCTGTRNWTVVFLFMFFISVKSETEFWLHTLKRKKKRWEKRQFNFFLHDFFFVLFLLSIIDNTILYE